MQPHYEDSSPSPVVFHGDQRRSRPLHQKRSALEGAGLKQLSGLWGQKKTGSSSMLKHHGQFHVVNTYAEIRIIPLSCRAITTRNTREAWGWRRCRCRSGGSRTTSQRAQPAGFRLGTAYEIALDHPEGSDIRISARALNTLPCSKSMIA